MHTTAWNHTGNTNCKNYNNKHSTSKDSENHIWDTLKPPIEPSDLFHPPRQRMHQVGAYHHPCPCARTAITLLEPSGGCYHVLTNGEDLTIKIWFFNKTQAKTHLSSNITLGTTYDDKCQLSIYRGTVRWPSWGKQTIVRIQYNTL